MEIKIFKDKNGNEFRYREVAITNEFAQSVILDDKVIIGEIDKNGKVTVSNENDQNQNLMEGDIVPTELNRDYLNFAEIFFPTHAFETLTDDELVRETYIWFGIKELIY